MKILKFNLGAKNKIKNIKLHIVTAIKKTDTHVLRQKNSFLHRLVFFCSSKVPKNKKITMVKNKIVIYCKHGVKFDAKIRILSPGRKNRCNFPLGNQKGRNILGMFKFSGSF